MHKGHTHSPGHEHEQDPAGTERLRKLLAMLEHWVDHSDSHVEAYQEWARRASEGGEEEVAREIHLAVEASGSVKDHLKRAKSILAAKLVVRK